MLIRTALMLTLIGASLGAQMLNPGESPTGTLGPDNPRSERGAPMDIWTLTVPADHAVQIRESADFDTFLHVRLANGTELTNDDFGNGTDSRVLVLNPGAEPLEVIPSSFLPNVEGDYTIEATLLPVERLDDSGVHTGEIGRGADLLGFTLPADTPMLVEVTSEDFDPILEVTLPGGVTLRDDDGGEGTNALLLLESPTPAEVRAAVRPFRGRGAYRLETAPLAFDGEVNLASGWEPSLRGSAFLIEGEPEQRVHLLANARRIRALATDADPQVGDASLLATLPESGRLVVLLSEEGTLRVQDEGLPMLPSELTRVHPNAEGFVVVAHSVWDGRMPPLEDFIALSARLGMVIVQTIEAEPSASIDSRWTSDSRMRFLDDMPETVDSLGALLPTGHLVAMPTVFLARADGRLIDVWNGPFRMDDLEAWVREGLGID
jgi:hypothetical protein